MLDWEALLRLGKPIWNIPGIGLLGNVPWKGRHQRLGFSYLIMSLLLDLLFRFSS